MVRQYYKEEKIVLDSEDFTDVEFTIENQGLKPYYKSPNKDFLLAHGDCFKLLEEFDFKFGVIFASLFPLQRWNIVAEWKGRVRR